MMKALFIDKYLNVTYKWLRKLDFGHVSALYLNAMVNVIVVFGIAYIVDRVFKRVLIYLLNNLAKRTKTTFDDFLITNNTAKYVAHLFPLLFIYHALPLALKSFVNWESLFIKGVKIYIVFLFLWIVRSILRALRDFMKTQSKYYDKPIDSYVQVIMIILWIFAILATLVILSGAQLGTLFGVFGGISAVILLVFRDTILGFVASIQVSVNDMIRIGDWITSDKYGADGEVVEINLATVKVTNFDNTTTTIPTYSLISDSFRNWRGMLNSGGRQIKKHILIKANSVRFLTSEDLENYTDVQFLKAYIAKKQAEITPNHLNGKTLTNLGLFRKYTTEYLSHHSGINIDMPHIVRYLQLTDKGIPVEIYCFAKDKRWENYEAVTANILDHVIASAEYFGLELFEAPTSSKSHPEIDH